MAGKFDMVPVESDTVILAGLESMLGMYDVLYQKWLWDGIQGESFIFVSSDVAGLDDPALEALARSSPMLKPGCNITMTRGDQFNSAVSVRGGHVGRRRARLCRAILGQGLVMHGLSNGVGNVVDTANDFRIGTVAQIMHTPAFASTATEM